MTKLTTQLWATSLAILLSAASLSAVANTEETTSTDSYQKEEPTKADYQGGYLKLGYGYKSEVGPYADEDQGGSLFVSGRYQGAWGFFIEASYGANELDQGLNLGYNLYNTDNWHYDIMTLTAHGENEYAYKMDDTPLVVENFDPSTMLGLRASGNFYGKTAQFVIAPISFNGDYSGGVYASAWMSQAWQIKNWEIYASGGFEYRSEAILDYYYSTTDEQRKLSLPEYKAGHGIDFIGQIGASYPVSENILFETYYRYTNVSDSITDSPIMKLAAGLPTREENITEFGILFSYVF